MAKPRILIVYYSRSGTTRILAAVLSKALSCDVEEIADLTSRKSFVGYWRSLIEARRGIQARIAPTKRLPSSYDLVIIGTPVWAWTVSSPIRAYLLANKSLFPDVSFFCTMGGRGSTRAFREIQRLIGKPPRAVLAVKAREVAANNYSERLRHFVKMAQAVP